MGRNFREKRKSSKSSELSYQNLERRQLLATASIQPVSGRLDLVVDGTNANDVVVVNDLNASQVRLTINGEIQDFDTSDFDRIRFLGRSGNDQFTNNTQIDSTAFGHGGDDILRGGDGINRIQGGSGNDQIFGGDRNDVLRGRGGNDTIEGGRRHDRIFGNEGNDTIIAGAGNDFIQGNEGVDRIFGLNGNDRILGAEGNDVIETGAGTDTVRYTSAQSSFSVFGEQTLRVSANAGSDGTDTVTGAEFLEFTDVTINANAALTADRQVIVRPIIVSNSNGSNTAEFFGNEEQAADIRLKIDELFSQADIDIEFEDAVTYNNSFANVGNGGTRPVSDLNSIVTNGDSANVGSPSATVIDVYFVEAVPGFGNVGENVANGLAFIDASGIAVHVGDTLVNSDAGRAVVARVVAHELGHNLGLAHVNDPTNLLNEDGAGEMLTQAQINAIRASDFSRNV